MAKNRGKEFEDVVKTAFEKVDGVSVDRIHDQTTGYKGSSNICDFIVYREPYEYYIECKSVHGNTFSINSIDKTGRGEIYGNITKKQWTGLLEKSKIPGVTAGVLVWWIDRDITRFIPIQTLVVMKEYDFKSLRYDIDVYQGENTYIVNGKKKRVFFDYDMEEFLNELSRSC